MMEQHVAEHAAGKPLPAIRSVGLGRSLTWLGRGLRDVMRAPLLSLGFGVLVAAFGAILLAFASNVPWLAPALLGGFLLVAPFLAIGVYSLSQQIERGHAINARQAATAWRQNANSIGMFGLLLAFMLLSWERTAAIIFALFYGGQVVSVQTLVGDVLFSGRYPQLLIAFVAAGGLFALVVFATSVVSAPMLLDRDIDVATAVLTSIKCCLENPAAMFVWAALIAALTLIGFATFMLGLILIFPLIGHASWHAYRDLVEPERSAASIAR